MSDVVIRVEHLYKEYRLGTISHGTLYKDLQSWWARMRGKEDPNSIISAVHVPILNSRRSDENPHMLALNDVSFEVKEGDVLGIIGRNGAGKSTLLKILSEVISPTKGQVKIKGRVASLLEVGTGFHPELTGRENIYLNGAILGMTKKEIDNKFDEIIAFAEVEKFIDTPVKRYSSGMYVRLAFAVAAHLEPEILIVDEVLAVGDAAFQKKCLGKMGDVAKEGRTVLFVSHNMTAIKNLCNRAILLNCGNLKEYGEAYNVIDKYLSNSSDVYRQVWNEAENAPGNHEVKVKKIELILQSQHGAGEITVENPFDIEFDFWNFKKNAMINLSMHLYSISGELVFAATSPSLTLPIGISSFSCHIMGGLLNDGHYKISMMIVEEGKPLFTLNDGLVFKIHDAQRKGYWFDKWPGAVRPKLEWRVPAVDRIEEDL
ncbi:MAG: ABC transporter ATP-binding protein [Nitrospirae bacterium]|nr:ABC transporter ATP-binding protein [Nitrospirota bacterium]